MKKILNIYPILFITLLSMSIITACSKDDDEESLSGGIDSRFVGTWMYDNSVPGVVERATTLILNANGTASYSWYRHSNTVGNYNHSSDGTWSYDKESNRIITDCITDGASAPTLILNVISVSETTLVVRQEGANQTRTYYKQ